MTMLRVSQLRELSLGNRYFIAITRLDGDGLAGKSVPSVLLFFEKGAASRDVLQGFFHSFVVRKCLENLQDMPDNGVKARSFPRDSCQQSDDAKCLLELFAKEQNILQWALNIVKGEHVLGTWASNRSFVSYETLLEKEGWNTEHLFLEKTEARVCFVSL